jgi:hypothetical protein
VLVTLAAASFGACSLLKPKPVFGQPPPRGALRIARLKHAGDWNIAPRAIPNLIDALRKPPLRIGLNVESKHLSPRDPDLTHYPLIFIQGREAFAFSTADLAALRRYLEPGWGTLFADAACGSAAFDASFRRFVTELFPNHPLVPIPRDDDLYSTRVGFDLKDCHYTKATGGRRDYPQFEGVKLVDRWAIIYSKYGVACAWERDHDGGCKGYLHADAVKIGVNVVMYSTLP